MSASHESSILGVSGHIISEFIRKLYGMLEDPENQDVARWGKDGNSLVVVENEKFIYSILPKHFKYTNMTSFVRQLNKYGFQKVRQTNDSDIAANDVPTLHFRHPCFRLGSQDDLCRIHPKLQASRRTQATKNVTTNYDIGIITKQFADTQKQVQRLHESLTILCLTNRNLVNEVMALRKMVNKQRQSQHEILEFLCSLSHCKQQTTSLNAEIPFLDNSIHMVSGLRRAYKPLFSVPPNQHAEREVERLQTVYGCSTNSVTTDSMPMIPEPMKGINRYIMYPIGRSLGSDPAYAAHTH